MTAIASSTTGTTIDNTPAVPRDKGVQWNVIGRYVGIAFIIVWCLLPFYWMAVVAFRDVGYTFSANPLPSHITMSNFTAAFDTSKNHFGRALVNSIIIGSITTVIAMAVGVFSAYALARLHFKGKFFVLGLILAAAMFPGVALLTPLFQLFTNAGLLGTYPALIIPYIAFALPLSIYTLTSFFAEMPWELEQAARVDGATPGQAFRLVIFPLCAPGLFTTAILVFLNCWNEFLLASVLPNGKASVAPVTYAIASFTGSDPKVIPYTSIMAAGVVVTIPLVIVVLLFQRRIVSGLTAGGVKG